MAQLKDPVITEDHIQGDNNASITLVEYGDYECPFCGMVYPIVKTIQNHFDKQLRFVFRNFPLTEAHPHAEMAAETAEFANDYKLFWEMHDLIYENQAQLSKSMLLGIGESLELPRNKLEFAIDKKLYAPKIRKDFMGGVRSGVNGTPTFFINEIRYNGPMDFESMVSAIQSVLKEVQFK